MGFSRFAVDCLYISTFTCCGHTSLVEALTIIIIIISKFIKLHVCLQKAAEALVRCRSDSLVTAIKTGSRKMSFKTIVQIVQHDFCRQTVPNDRCGIGVAYLCSHRVSRTSVLEETHPRLFQLLQTILGTVHGTCSACVHCVMIQTVPSVD